MLAGALTHGRLTYSDIAEIGVGGHGDNYSQHQEPERLQWITPPSYTCESLCERAPGFPRRPAIRIGQSLHQLIEKVVELSSRGGHPRLVQIVQRAVIALRIPFAVRNFIRRSLLISEYEAARGHADPHKAVMIAAA